MPPVYNATKKARLAKMAVETLSRETVVADDMGSIIMDDDNRGTLGYSQSIFGTSQNINSSYDYGRMVCSSCGGLQSCFLGIRAESPR